MILRKVVAMRSTQRLHFYFDPFRLWRESPASLKKKQIKCGKHLFNILFYQMCAAAAVSTMNHGSAAAARTLAPKIKKKCGGGVATARSRKVCARIILASTPESHSLNIYLLNVLLIKYIFLIATQHKINKTVDKAMNSKLRWIFFFKEITDSALVIFFVRQVTFQYHNLT